jgi:hypothetical protein
MSMKEDAHVIDHLDGFVGVVAPRPGSLLYLGKLHPSPHSRPATGGVMPAVG